MFLSGHMSAVSALQPFCNCFPCHWTVQNTFGMHLRVSQQNVLRRVFRKLISHCFTEPDAGVFFCSDLGKLAKSPYQMVLEGVLGISIHSSPVL